MKPALKLPNPLDGRRADVEKALQTEIPGGWSKGEKYMPADQPKAIAEVLVGILHLHLKPASIAYLYREKMSGRGRVKLAKVKKADPTLATLEAGPAAVPRRDQAGPARAVPARAPARGDAMRHPLPAGFERRPLQVPFSVEAPGLVWMAVHGFLCLALRHPARGPSRELIDRFVLDLGAHLVDVGILTPEELAEAEGLEAAETQRRCKRCGCTDERGCPEGCGWHPALLAMGRTVCTRCATLLALPTAGDVLPRSPLAGGR